MKISTCIWFDVSQNPDNPEINRYSHIGKDIKILRFKYPVK